MTVETDDLGRMNLFWHATRPDTMATRMYMVECIGISLHLH